MSKKFNEEEFQEFVIEQFSKLTTELSDVRGDVSNISGEMRAGIADVRAEMQTGFRTLRTEVAEIKEVLEPLVKAFDSDAETMVEHGRRISRLEQLRGNAAR